MKRLLFVLFFTIPFFSYAEQFTPGKDYIVINATNLEPPVKGKVSVTEFFSYGCPWCYKLEKSLDAWRKNLPNSVGFSRTPVIFEPGWDVYAKAYYTAVTLGINNKLTPALFKAIQEEQQHLNKAPAMIKFFIKNGVKEQVANSAFNNSSVIDAKVKNGMQKMQYLGIMSVPAIVIQNRYRVDLQTAGGDEKRLFEICSFLIKKALLK